MGRSWLSADCWEPDFAKDVEMAFHLFTRAGFVVLGSAQLRLC